MDYKRQNLTVDETSDLSDNRFFQYLHQSKAIFQYIVMPFVVVLSSTLSLINLIMWSYYRLGFMSSDITHQYLVVSDWMVVFLFVVELLFNVVLSEDLDEVLDVENLIIVLITFEICWKNTGQEDFMVFYFLHAQSFRSLRVGKMRYVTRLFGQIIHRYNVQRTKEDASAEVDEEEEMNKFIIEQLINFTGGILIQSSLLLALDRALDYQGFAPFQGSEKFDYVNAAYFVIISFSTIGSGDIVPICRESRLCVVVLLIFNITVMSNYLADLIQKIYSLSPYNKDYDFKDHVVIIGMIEKKSLFEFLEELVENDLVDRSTDLLTQMKVGIKCIVVVDEEPTSQHKYVAEYLSDLHENEIVYLKENIYAKKWYKKANLGEAKVLFAFTGDNSNVVQAYHHDQLITHTAKNIKDEYPWLRVHVVLNSEFKRQVDRDPFFLNLETLSRHQMNDFIMASSLENPGLGTTLQHLFTMKSKTVTNQIMNATQNDHFLKAYIRDMQSEIYLYPIPDYYVGMSFRKLAQILYLHNIECDLSGLDYTRLVHHDRMLNNNALTLIAIETIQDENFQSMNDFSDSEVHRTLEPSAMSKATKLSFKRSVVVPYDEPSPGKDESPSVQQQSVGSINEGRKLYSTQILINPQKYYIRKNDIAYVVCKEYDVARQFDRIANPQSNLFQQFAENYSMIGRGVSTKKDRARMIAGLFDQLVTRQHVKQKRKLQRRPTLYAPTEIDLKLNSSVQHFINLFEDEMPVVHFEHHVIIFGSLATFHNLLYVLRKYSNRQIVLFSHEELDLQKWTDIQSLADDVYYVRGDYLSLSHLANLHINQAEQVLIKSDLLTRHEDFPDSIGMCVARILMDYFDCNHYLLEVKDSSKLGFLNQNPLLRSIETPLLLHMSFMQGNVHLSSMPIGVLSKVVYNESWIRLFQDLVVPKKYEKRTLNQTMNSLNITKEIEQELKYFGILQFALMENKPSCIGLSLIKKKIGSKYQEVKLNQLLRRDHVKRLLKDFKNIDRWECNLKHQTYDKDQTKSKFEKYVQQTLGRIIGHSYVLTNPQFYTPIEEGDSVLVIGDMMDHDSEELPANHRPVQNVKSAGDKGNQRIRLKESVCAELESRLQHHRRMERYTDLLKFY